MKDFGRKVDGRGSPVEVGNTSLRWEENVENLERLDTGTNLRHSVSQTCMLIREPCGSFRSCGVLQVYL